MRKITPVIAPTRFPPLSITDKPPQRESSLAHARSTSCAIEGLHDLLPRTKLTQINVPSLEFVMLIIGECHFGKRRALLTRFEEFMTSSDNSWNAIATAPFDRDLELGVMEGSDVHALVFACRRILGGWINATTRERVPVHPTHWRDWSDHD